MRITFAGSVTDSVGAGEALELALLAVRKAQVQRLDLKQAALGHGVTSQNRGLARVALSDVAGGGIVAVHHASVAAKNGLRYNSTLTLKDWSGHD